MNVGAYEIALIGGGFTILGALIGALVGYWLARLLANRYAIIAAKSKLRSAFSGAQAIITVARLHAEGDHRRPSVSDFVREAFVVHAAAIEEFRPFVCAKDREAYQKAWQEYCVLELPLWDGGIFMAYDGENPEFVIENKINDILLFAKT
jgi:hypothetical protein